jgi:hypothetical protein
MIHNYLRLHKLNDLRGVMKYWNKEKARTFLDKSMSHLFIHLPVALSGA